MNIIFIYKRLTSISVELILSIVLAVSTICYTIINLMMWFKSKATSKQKLTPFVIAYLQITNDHNMLCVHIKNIREGCTKDVKAKLLKGYNQFGKETFPLSDCIIFKNGANIFPLQYELKYYIDKPQDINYSSDDSFVELEPEYSDTYNRRFNENIFKLPFNQIGGDYSDPPESYLGQIPYYLKKLNTTIEKIKK